MFGGGAGAVGKAYYIGGCWFSGIGGRGGNGGAYRGLRNGFMDSGKGGFGEGLERCHAAAAIMTLGVCIMVGQEGL